MKNTAMIRETSFDAALKEALALLKTPSAHAVLLLPTETVYGLVCAWNDSAAREKIYAMKRRSADKLLAAFVHDTAALRGCCPPLPELARRFAGAFCPGPITLVVPDGLGGTFGFRIPDHPFLLRLMEEYDAPLASTSANLSGLPAALTAEEALSSLVSEPELLYDAGRIPASSGASTVVSVDAACHWRILREGPVSRCMLEEIASSGCPSA